MKRTIAIILSVCFLILFTFLCKRNIRETKILADIIIGKLSVPNEYQYIHADTKGLVIPQIRVYYPPYNSPLDRQFKESVYDVSGDKSPIFTWRLIVFVKDSNLIWQQEGHK